MTGAKEPGSAACSKPDSPIFSYVELTLNLKKTDVVSHFQDT
ncbi:hypothetical protein LEP1GSC082_3535 [Leptospira kirschneri str. H2]|uniref:Uncharacterized protein n=1 Tax=Leptospira kirschneri str. H1 TaxID=1049966 RepID=A0A0E2B4Y2_9LEPT|nr:hypothetical protein LEP1GSC081_3792 [Leptospira kirschneri str. H1]EKO60224.1 hypothetical protein LEP1GSC082_3535 [Leptospira kirschneri str. H2]